MQNTMSKKRIYFCSGNNGKYDHLLLNTQHIDSIEIIQKHDLDIVEPQLNTIEEIALHKAKVAFKKLNEPVIVQDSGLVIKSLHDFPGPYTKYVSQTIGCRGILKLLVGHTDRSCGFYGCLVFIDKDGKINIFKEGNKEKYWGKIVHDSKIIQNILDDSLDENTDTDMSDKPCLGRLASSWSCSNPNNNFWTIFVPLDIQSLSSNEKTLAQLSEDEMISYRKSRKSSFKEFAKWLDNNI